MRKLLKRISAVLGLALLGASVYIWSIWPPTMLMSEGMVKWRLHAAFPKEVVSADPWVARGEYLVRTAPCGICHTPFSWVGPNGNYPLQGGMQARWDVYGEAVALNLTPDPATGIGKWSERDWIVAMKSGIYPDGRVAHWQAMPWDMHSNFSLDDMRAIYRYLQSLPPATRPPSRKIDDPLPEPVIFYYGR